MSDEELQRPEVYLKWLAQEMKSMRQMMQRIVNYMDDAEKEIPERIRRFTHHMHSMHDIKYMHEELGVAVPTYILRELERVDDRFRQLVAELNADDGAFGKVRREMATDPMNRYDHTQALPAPTHLKKEIADEDETH